MGSHPTISVIGYGNRNTAKLQRPPTATLARIRIVDIDALHLVSFCGYRSPADDRSGYFVHSVFDVGSVSRKTLWMDRVIYHCGHTTYDMCILYRLKSCMENYRRIITTVILLLLLLLFEAHDKGLGRLIQFLRWTVSLTFS